MPTLLGLTLLGSVAAAPAFAQSDRDYKTQNTTTGYLYTDWINANWALSHDNDIVFWPDQASIDAGKDFVYVLRGNTLYQMHVGDFSLSAMNSLPWLNMQADYNLPQTAQGKDINTDDTNRMAQGEDYDVYNQMYRDDPAIGNTDTERQSEIRAYPDYPPAMAQSTNDNSDLKGRTLYHRHSVRNVSSVTTPSMMPPATISASGDYVYILRGNTLTQLRVSDLSLVNQKDLPTSDTEMNNTEEKPVPDIDIPDDNANPGTDNPDEVTPPDMPNP